MSVKNNNKIAHAIKEHLVNLAIDNQLPLDMNDLDVGFILEILEENQETYKDCAIRSAEHYLSDSEGTILEQIEAIAKQAEIDGDVLIDDVDGVVVWDKLENTFTCDEFLEMIGWDLI